MLWQILSSGAGRLVRSGKRSLPMILLRLVHSECVQVANNKARITYAIADLLVDTTLEAACFQVKLDDFPVNATTAR